MGQGLWVSQSKSEEREGPQCKGCQPWAGKFLEIWECILGWEGFREGRDLSGLQYLKFHLPKQPFPPGGIVVWRTVVILGDLQDLPGGWQPYAQRTICTWLRASLSYNRNKENGTSPPRLSQANLLAKFALHTAGGRSSFSSTEYYPASIPLSSLHTTQVSFGGMVKRAQECVQVVPHRPESRGQGPPTFLSMQAPLQF